MIKKNKIIIIAIIFLTVVIIGTIFVNRNYEHFLAKCPGNKKRCQDDSVCYDPITCDKSAGQYDAGCGKCYYSATTCPVDQVRKKNNICSIDKKAAQAKIDEYKNKN